MSSNIARLGVALAINTVDFIKGLAVADQKSKEFKKSLREANQTAESLKTGVAIAGAALVAFGANALSVADEISDLADANDTTVGSIIELQHALEMSGGKADSAGKLLSSFTNSIDGAAQGSDKLRDSFKSVGVSISDLANLSADELKTKTLSGLAGIDDSVRRNAVAMDLFGKAAKGVDFSAMGTNAEQLRGKYDAQAKAVKDAADAFQKIKMFIGDMQIAAMQAMQPITQLINKMPTEDRIESMAKWFTYLGEVMLFAFGVKAVSGVIKLANSLRVLALSNPWLIALAAGGAVAAHYGLAEIAGGEVGDSPTSPDKGSSGGGASRSIEQSSRDKMIAKYAAEYAELNKLFELKKKYFVMNQNNSLEELNLEGEKYKLSANEYKFQQLLIDEKKAHAIFAEKYESERTDALKQLNLASSEEYSLAKKNYDLKTKNITELENIERNYIVDINNKKIELFDAEVERQQSWAAGWEEAMKRYEEASLRASERGGAAFDSVINNMDRALSNFVQTGKLNFKDLMGSIIKDLMLAELKARASSLFGSLVKTAFSAFTGFGGSSAAGVNAIAGNTSSFGFAASGGYIDSPTIVGENGAELFVPRTAGTIIPNGAWQSQVSGNSGGMTINGNYIANMSAIDTQSGMQFLAKNRDTIWAAYQSANRSVPISR